MATARRKGGVIAGALGVAPAPARAPPALQVVVLAIREVGIHLGRPLAQVLPQVCRLPGAGDIGGRFEDQMAPCPERVPRGLTCRSIPREVVEQDVVAVAGVLDEGDPRPPSNAVQNGENQAR